MERVVRPFITERYYFEDITDQTFTLNSDSTIDVPTGSGLGVTLNEEALAKVTLAKRTVK